MKVINLFSGPGAGTSTTAAQLYAELKWAGINCEMVREWIKEKVWQGEANESLSNQLYVFAKQHNGLYNINNKVDYAITDSPLPLSIIYNKQKDSLFDSLVIHEFNKFNNINIFLTRNKPYSGSGRYQTLEEAQVLDEKIKNLLRQYALPYTIIEGTNEATKFIRKILGV